GNKFSGRITPLFLTMLVQAQKEVGEGSANPIDPHHIPTDSQPSTLQPQQKQTSRKSKKKNIEVPHPSDSTDPLLSDEERLEHHELTDNVPTPHDSPLLGGNTPGSDEGRPNLTELIDICTKLSDRVLNLEKEKDAQAVEILNLKKRVKKLEIKVKSRIPPPNRRLYKQLNDMVDDVIENVEGDAKTQRRNTAKQITIVGDTVSTVGPSSSTADVFKDELMTMADTLVAIRRTRPRTTSVVIHDPEKEPTRIVPVPTTQSQPSYNNKGKEKMVELEEPVKIKRRDQGMDQVQADAELTQRLYQEDLAELERVQRERAAQEEASKAAINKELDDIQAMIEADEQLAERLHSEEQEKYTIEEKVRMLVEMIAERKKFFTAQRAAEIRIRPPTKAHMRNRMCTYLKSQASYTHKQLKGRSYDEIQKLFDIAYKQVSSFVPMDTETQILGNINKEDIVVYQIRRADGSAKYYKFFSDMLEDFDRQDLLDLYRLVMERFESSTPEGYNLLLWGDLKTVFDPNEEDKVWNNQQE
ncbi:hypothetical protein Tco_1259431, partial [Tanacetum coccineum]